MADTFDPLAGMTQGTFDPLVRSEEDTFDPLKVGPAPLAKVPSVSIPKAPASPQAFQQELAEIRANRGKKAPLDERVKRQVERATRFARSLDTNVDLKVPRSIEPLNILGIPELAVESGLEGVLWGIKGLTVAIDAALATGATVAGSLFGMDKTQENRLARDLLNLSRAAFPEVAGISAGATALRTVKQTSAQFDKQVNATLRGHGIVDPNDVNRVKEVIWKNLDAEAAKIRKDVVGQSLKEFRRETGSVLSAAEQTGAQVPLSVSSKKIPGIPDIPDGFVQLIPKSKDASSIRFHHAYQDLLEATGTTPRPGVISPAKQFVQMVTTPGITDEALGAILRKHGIGQEEVFEMIRNLGFRTDTIKDAVPTQDTVKAALRMRGSLGSERAMTAFNRRVGREISSYDRMAKFMWYYRDIDNIRRGLMVSQLGTASRNALSAMGRVTMNNLVRATDIALDHIAHAFGLRDDLDDVLPLRGIMSDLEMLFAMKRKDVDTILDAFPVEKLKLFNRFNSDVNVIGNTFRQPNIADKAVYWANIFNRTQEFFFRRVRFSAYLDEELRRKGTSLRQVIRENDLDAVDANMLGRAVEEGLNFTFAADPKSSFLKHAVDTVHRIPGLTLLVPFPRYMAAALEFMHDYSPTGLASTLVSKAMKGKRAQQPMAMAKGIVGTAMLFSAYEFRSSEWAGPNWNQIRKTKGTDADGFIDVKTLGPFQAYFFVGDYIKRLREGRLDETGTASSVAEGVLGQASRVNTVAELTSAILRAIADQERPGVDKSKDIISRAGAGIIGGFLTPLNQISDLMEEFDSWDTYRGREVGPHRMPSTVSLSFLDGLYRAVPGLRGQVPVKPNMFGQPDLKSGLGGFIGSSHVTGVPTIRKNPMETLFDELDIPHQKVTPKTGSIPANRLVQAEMGAVLVEKGMTEFDSPEWVSFKNRLDRLPHHMKKVVATNFMQEIRRAGAARAFAKAPKLFAMLKMIDGSSIDMLKAEQELVALAGNPGMSRKEIAERLHAIGKEEAEAVVRAMQDRASVWGARGKP